MSEAAFIDLRRFLKARSGLDLGADKLYLAESRLAPVWRTAGLAGLAELVAAVKAQDSGRLAQSVVEAMATNETMFFRDKPLFDVLRERVLPSLVTARAATRRLRLWSAAASTGQEAYSLAMLMADLPARPPGWQVSILATDLSSAAIARARSGTYSQFEVQRGLPIRSLLRHFTQSGLDWTISAELRRLVEFRVFNLLDDLGPLGTFDVILCRNLLIYLDREAKITLLTKLAGALAADGTLCLGTSETTLGLTPALAPDPESRGVFVHAGRDAAHGPRRAAG